MHEKKDILHEIKSLCKCVCLCVCMCVQHEMHEGVPRGCLGVCQVSATCAKCNTHMIKDQF